MKLKITKPKVSICIPTYNQTELLEKTFESILNQDYKDYEVIITDDSDSNKVELLIENYKLKFQHKLKYFKNKCLLGSPGNWNESMRRATGEYIKILHHDDCFSDVDSLRILVNLLDGNPKATIGFVSSVSINTNNNSIININTPDKFWIDLIENVPEMLIARNFIGSPSATIFRVIDPNFQFDLNLKWFVDVDAYVCLLKFKDSQIAFNPKRAVDIGISNLQVTRICENSKSINLFEFFYFLKKWKIKNVKINELIHCKTKSIMEQFNVKNIDEIKELGISWDLPINTRSIINTVNKR